MKYIIFTKDDPANMELQFQGITTCCVLVLCRHGKAVTNSVCLLRLRKSINAKLI